MKTFNLSVGKKYRLIAFVLLLAVVACKKDKHPKQPVVQDVAGNGTFGFADGAASTAQFSYPTSLAVDAQGNIYVADYINNRIRKITPSGMVSTLAGSGERGFADGAGSSAKFDWPYGVTVDAQGNVYVADLNNSRIRKITPSGMVSSFAGTGTPGRTDGVSTMAQFNAPTGVACDANGNIFVADQGQNLVRKITPSGVVSTFAGSTSGFADGAGSSAQFFGPYSVACDVQGNVYVADRLNHRIRKIAASGQVSTIAGDGTRGFADGAGATSRFDTPSGVACDRQGNVYVADVNNHKIRKITPSGNVSTWAGTVTGFANGAGSSAQFNQPTGVACDAQGNVYIADYLNSRVRKIVLQ